MPWSGKDAALASWLPRFANPERCRASIDKYIRSSTVLDDARCDAWLTRDLERDKELAAIADPEDYVAGPSRFDLNDCYHCYGCGYVRRDLEQHGPNFGRALLCPGCAGSNGDRSAHCQKCADFSKKQAEKPERNQCWKCGHFEDEMAAENCTNPRWHLPNVNFPAQPSVTGWTRVFNVQA